LITFVKIYRIKTVLGKRGEKMVSVFKNLVIHLRRWMKFLIILAIGLGIILFVVFSTYKPMYSVSLDGKFLGYTDNKKELQDKINEYMKKGDQSSNIAFVDIESLPEYSFCLRKKDSQVDNDKILNDIISTGVTYYKYYAILVNSEEKYYVSTFQECDNIIEQLKEKDSENIDSISYIVKYETGMQDFTEPETVVAELYVERPVIVEATPIYTDVSSSGSVITGANISYSIINLGSLSFINPISGVITSRFGVLSSIRSSYHTGLDIGSSIGTPIAAAESGVVEFSGWKSAYGQMITIDHGDGIVTYYAHCSALYKSVGEYVEQGEIIAAVGMTGNTTGPHLHIEVRKDGVAYDPIDYFDY